MEKKYGVWAVRSAASIFGSAQAWCKHYGRPLDFETFADAEAYAKRLNGNVRTGNVHYHVKEKEPETEVPISSAVQSNYVGMVAMVGANEAVYLGKKENYHFADTEDGHAYYDNRDGSLCLITTRTDMYSFLYSEGWVHSQAEMLKHGLTMDQYMEFARLRSGVLRQFEVKQEILFDGQPFQPPENYLRTAELTEECQTGNYNMIDGLMNNEPPKPDDPEKPSVREKLKTDCPEHEERRKTPPVPERDQREL